MGNETGSVSSSVVRHGPKSLAQARTVAAAVPGAVLQASDSIGDAVQLVIGPNYSKVIPVQAAASSPAAKSPPPAEASVPTPKAVPVSC